MIIKKKKQSILTLLLVSLIISSCSGQGKTDQQNKSNFEQLSFTSKNPRLTKTQGTNAYQNVHCIIQDKEGNIWIGTTGEGVYRYDGKEFTQYTEKDGLSNNVVWSILEDKLGNIWFGTNDGVSQYDGKTISKVAFTINTLSSFGMPGTQPDKNIVWSIIQDKSGMIWFGTEKGVYCYNGKIFSYFLSDQKIINKSDLTLKSVQCMFEDRNGNMWFGSGPMALEGIIGYDGKSLINYKPKEEGWIRTITDDRNGALLFATRHNAIIAYDGKIFSDFTAPHEMRIDLVNAFLVDSKGNFWYATDYKNDNDITTGGLWKFDGKSFIEFTKKDGLFNSSIYSLMEDKTGNLWIGTRNCGLYLYDGKTFSSFSQ